LGKKHVILVGLPGSGKSTVGRLAAGALGAPFVDLDLAIERRAGKTVQRLFAEDGESAFRALESALGAEVLAGPPAVLAPGGGFLLDPGRRSRALKTALIVYLETAPAVAASRLAGAAARPLLEGDDAAPRLRRLLEQREALYLEAHGKVTTDALTPSAVAAAVAALARQRGGW
jgi:shikimate kinase